MNLYDSHVPAGPCDSRVAMALIGQVTSARLSGGIPSSSEVDVLTIISRPMWEAFLRFIGAPPGSKPTCWKGTASLRVYGSETHVVESDDYWSFSRIKTPLNP